MEEITTLESWWTLQESAMLVLVYYLAVDLYTMLKIPKAYIVEDSPSDLELYRYFIGDLDGKCKIKYFTSLSEITGWDLYFKPRAVVVDQHLKGKTPGNELFSHCARTGIPVFMVSGDKDVKGVPPNRLIHKSSTNNHFLIIRSWLNQLVTQ